MKYFITLIAIALLVSACDSSPTATPTTAPTTVPTAVPQPTQAPTNTTLPPTPTPAPTNTVPPPTNTAIPTTPTATATNTLAPVTAQPTVAAPSPTATATAVVLKYSAPTLSEPVQGATFSTSSDMVFKWQPVATLGTDECYLVTVRIINAIDNEPAEQSFLAQNTCNDAGNAPVSFLLDNRAPAPDYAGLLAHATSKTPANLFRVTWNVLVVQNLGVDPNNPDPALYVPLSPPSETFEFNLEG